MPPSATRYVSLYKSQNLLHYLLYEMVIEKAKAHEHNILEYKDHQASHGRANSAPAYNNPLLSAHALSKRRPNGHGNNGQHCGKCGKSHERGNCPTYGKTCDKCKGINHFKAVCCSKVTAKMAQSPHQSKKSQPHRHSSTGSYSGQGKGGGNHQHQKKKTPKKLLKQKAYAVTFKNSVPLGVTTTSGGERERIMEKYHQRWSFQDQRKVCTTGFRALQFEVNCLKAPTPRVSPWRDCILTLTQTIGLRSLQMSPSGCQVKLV